MWRSCSCWCSRGCAPGTPGLVRESGWRDELVLPILFYVLTICAWQTQFADLLFVLLAWSLSPFASSASLAPVTRIALRDGTRWSSEAQSFLPSCGSFTRCGCYWLSVRHIPCGSIGSSLRCQRRGRSTPDSGRIAASQRTDAKGQIRKLRRPAGSVGLLEARP
jgi:hypothetical protein